MVKKALIRIGFDKLMIKLLVGLVRRAKSWAAYWFLFDLYERDMTPRGDYSPYRDWSDKELENVKNASLCYEQEWLKLSTRGLTNDKE